MLILGIGGEIQKAHIRAIKAFTAFLGRSPYTTTPDDICAQQLHVADTQVTPQTVNVRISALRFSPEWLAGRRRSCGSGPSPASWQSPWVWRRLRRS
nr:phage integrase N-terminal SAM-like domain-containing protein [Palleronia abyssalis]